MVLDPRTVGYDTLDLRRADSFERELEAKFLMGFFDLVNDADENFTMKNQLFYDSMDQFKLSEQPGGGKQDVHVMENKFTVTRRLTDLPEWLDVNMLARRTCAGRRRRASVTAATSLRTARTAMLGDGTMTPNSTFIHPFDNPDILNDGAPWTSNYETEYYESRRRGAVRHRLLRAHEPDARRPLRQVARRERRLRQHVQRDDGHGREPGSPAHRATSTRAAATPAARGA